MTVSSPLPGETTDKLPPTTRLGYVHLTVNSLDRQVLFYTQVLGFQLHWREGVDAALGTASEILLRLTENPDARRVQRATGMYHFAVLYPSRKELARAIARLFALRYPNSPTDHGFSKTTYLDDFEGNTIELYVRSLDDAEMLITEDGLVVKYADGRVGDGRDPLDLDKLFSELDETDRLDTPLPDGTQIGHVHLYAASIEDSMHFYANILGFQEGPVIKSFRMGEVGLDAQQPHVVAFNTWKGEHIPPSPAGALGIRFFSIVLPDAAELQRVIERLQAAGIPVSPSSTGVFVGDSSQINIFLTDQMQIIE